MWRNETVKQKTILLLDFIKFSYHYKDAFQIQGHPDRSQNIDKDHLISSQRVREKKIHLLWCKCISIFHVNIKKVSWDPPLVTKKCLSHFCLFPILLCLNSIWAERQRREAKPQNVPAQSESWPEDPILGLVDLKDRIFKILDHWQKATYWESFFLQNKNRKGLVK